MISPEDLYIFDVTEISKDLFRLGNATWPQFNDVRARLDVPIEVQNGIEIVLANGNGFSASDTITSAMQRPGKRIWRIKKGALLPPEVVLVKDLRPNHRGHYMIAPAKTMPLKKFLGALEELGMDPTRVELVLQGDNKHGG